MSSLGKQTYDDQVLLRYLLGLLTAEETEHLDELSIADDEFALRLNVVENELVDAYVSNDLSGQNLEQFKTFYLSTVERRQRVAFAEALRVFAKGTAAAPSRTATLSADVRVKRELSQGASPGPMLAIPISSCRRPEARLVLHLSPCTLEQTWWCCCWRWSQRIFPHTASRSRILQPTKFCGAVQPWRRCLQEKRKQFPSVSAPAC